MGFAGDGGVCALWRRAEGPEERRLLELFSYGLTAMGAASALLLCFIPMPYGRYSSRRFGWLLPARPAWALQELPSLLVPLGLAACGGAVAAARPNRVLLGCFLLHYAHRALIFPLLIREGKPTPFFTFVLALLFCVFNGYLQGRSLTTYSTYPPGWLGDSRFITGWLIGMAINIHSDHILRNLRKPGETGYKIPRGGMFEYVSGANFLERSWNGLGLPLPAAPLKALHLHCVLSSSWVQGQDNTTTLIFQLAVDTMNICTFEEPR
ncbi:hypothetical protein DUI87_08069 [Hirundo rustica rustica]|uniref:3-oxo-5-alpha-steroid 4-dehydrogenase C-terminal domain-containing protein n=1 Tax=Hirundo rustica rustica TaxID=333673 RepID=A0A3M0KWQ1_HIRRU|nr:hypothetical protein DUI87_08069 [Hirundo rustica rustica]